MLKNQQLLKLQSLLPEIFTEGKIDFEKFQQLFADEISTESDRYQLNWAGKSAAYQTLQIPSNKTLTPCKAESVNFDETQNIFIEGENLDVLKVLQKSYFNSVKMIYIDPPYNTGNDFVYHDNFAQSQTEYLTQTGEKGEDGLLKKAFRKNSKENGHYHSNWLNMMLPRLHLARNLLKDDGVIFISIDDNEQAQLKLLCDEVFGEENFVAIFPWRKRTAKSDVPFGVSSDFEQIIVYAKSNDFLASVEGKERKYFETDDFPNRPWRTHDLTTQRNASERPNSFFDLIDPKTGKKYPANPLRTWAVTKDTFQEYYDLGRIVFPDDYDFLNISNPVMRYFKDDDMAKAGENFGRIAVSTKLPDDVGMSLNGTKEITEIFGNKLFDFPKPTALIKFFINMLFDKNALILDFFAGSGTTAHAVMQLNAEDGGNRKFICVQLPELTDEKSEAYQAGFKNIADISKERIRRAGLQIRQKFGEIPPLVDVGFKVFKLTESHFKQWQSPTKENMGSLVEQLEMYIDNVKENSDLQAVFYEILLRLGLKLTAEVHLENSVFWVNEDERLYAILLESVNEAILANVIAKQPQKVVALDRLFTGNDALKKNSELQMKDAGIAFFVI